MTDFDWDGDLSNTYPEVIQLDIHHCGTTTASSYILLYGEKVTNMLLTLSETYAKESSEYVVMRDISLLDAIKHVMACGGQLTWVYCDDLKLLLYSDLDMVKRGFDDIVVKGNIPDSFDNIPNRSS